MSYYQKYIKYKNKYINAKDYMNDQNGGNDMGPKTYEIAVENLWLRYISTGEKKIEGRLNKGIFKYMKEGNHILFFSKHSTQKVLVKILGVSYYKTFREMLQVENITDILPNIVNIDYGESIYRKYYSEELETENGVVAIKISLADSGLVYHKSSRKIDSDEYLALRLGLKKYDIIPSNKKINNGDILVYDPSFSSDEYPPSSAEFKINELQSYKTIREAILDKNYEEFCPWLEDIESVVKFYESVIKKQNDIILVNISELNPTYIHELKIQNPPFCPTFDLIKSGKKTVEGRKYSKGFHQYFKGDIIKFVHEESNSYCVITAINKYTALESYVETESYDRVLPCDSIKSISDAIKLYNKWSTQEDRDQLLNLYGNCFIGIHICKLI